MFSKTFIDKPKLSMVISIMIILAGVLCITRIPVAEYPEIAPPQITVTASYPGAGCQEVADTIAAPIETEMNGLENLLYFSSDAGNDGSYTLSITFASGTNTDIAQVNVQNAIKRAEVKLPAEVKALGINVAKRSSDMLGVFSFEIDEKKTSMTMLELANYVRINIKDDLARVNGISQADILGASFTAMRVWLDPLKMSALGISPDEITHAIQAQNIQAATGAIGTEQSNDYIQLKINAVGRLNTTEQFGNIIVRVSNDGRMVKLCDVARLELGAEDYSWHSSLSGKPVVLMAIYRNADANALEVMRNTRTLLDHLSRSFPVGVSYHTTYDPTKFITASMVEIISTLILTLLLVVIITYVFLQSWRATLIPALTIPVSIFGAFAILYPLGYSMNLLTMFALILVIGSLVDDAIVVVENVSRIMHEENLSAREATIKGMGQITGAIIATTLVTLAIYAPIAFYGGMVGTIYLQFSITMCVALLFSTLNALTLSPALCALLLKTNDEPSKIFKPFNFALDKSRNFYVRCTGGLVRKAWLTILLFAIVLAGNYFLFNFLPTAFLPPEDKGAIFVGFELAPGATLARTNKVIDEFYAKVKHIEGINEVIMISGFSFFGGKGENLALAIVTLKEWSERKTAATNIMAIRGQIVEASNSIIAAKTNVVLPPAIMGLGMSGGATFMLQARAGQNAQELETAANDLVGKIMGSPEAMMAFTTYNASTPQLFLDINRDRAAMMKVPVNRIFSTLQTKLASLYVNDFNLKSFTFRVKMQAESADRADLTAISHLNIQNENGKTVPLSSLAKLEYQVGPRVITRFNQSPSASITSMAKFGTSSQQLMNRIEQLVQDNMKGYQVAWTDLSYQERSNEGKIVYLLALALVFAYLFLVAQYESWTMPLAVVTSVAVATLGALISMLIVMMPMNIYAQLGLVMLIGLAGKNAILMAEFSRQARENGESIIDAAQNGGRVRYRAVLMTAWSFIIGVFPMVIATGAGAGSRKAIGITTFSGMLLATVIGIVFIPPLYAMFQRMREYFKHGKN